MLKKYLIGTLAILAVGFALTVSAADFGTTTLRVGSKGEAVKAVQTLVGATVDGSFGPMTAAKVKAWQANNGLTADGIFGKASKAKANEVATVPTTPGTTVAGCPAGALFNSLTGAACATGTTPVVTTTGVAGDITISNTTADVETTAPEGISTKVLGFKGEASGSDITIGNVKVTLENADAHATSTRLDHYASAVEVWMGSTKVGSASVSDFTKDGTLYTATIPLTGAVVKAGTANKATFYVTVTPLNSMDSADATGNATDNNWTAKVKQVRYTDGTGLTLSTDPSATVTKTFTFTKITTSGDLKVAVVASSNPTAGNVSVSDTGSTSDILLNRFTMKITGADMTMTALTVNTSVTGTGTTAGIAQSLFLKADGVQVAEIDSPAGAANSSAVAQKFTLDSDLVMKAGSTVTFTVYAKVNKIGTATFAQGDSLKASFTGTDAALELTAGGSSFSSKITGSSVGEAQTFYSKGVNASNFKSSIVATNDSNGVTKMQTYTVTFDVTAFGGTYYIPKSTVRDLTTAAHTGQGLVFSIIDNTGAANAKGTASASALSSSANTVGGYFEIPDGATKTFTATVALTSADDATITGHAALTVPGYYQVGLSTLRYDLDQAGVPSEYSFTPAQNFQTNSVQVGA